MSEQSSTSQSSDTSQRQGPVGQGDYVVKKGDCISSIAMDTGHFWETIWKDTANAELKRVRKDPNVLLEGDRVTIPEVKLKEEPGETDRCHRFRRRGEPAKLRLRFYACGKPLANKPYRIDIDGQRTIEGTLDGDGSLEVGIPGMAKMARVVVGEPNNEEGYEFNLGSVDPVTELSGVQQRLTNLGYPCLMEERLGDSTQAAILAFQKDKGLSETGQPDQGTQQALVDSHGS